MPNLSLPFSGHTIENIAFQSLATIDEIYSALIDHYSSLHANHLGYAFARMNQIKKDRVKTGDWHQEKAQIQSNIYALLNRFVTEKQASFWQDLRPMAIANIANSLAQLGIKLTIEDPIIQLILQEITNQDWRGADPIHFANTLNGLAQLGVKLNIHAPALQTIFAGMTEQNWGEAQIISFANILNGLAQLGIKLEEDGPHILPILIQQLLQGMTAQNWDTTSPLHFANALNGLAQMGVKLNADAPDILQDLIQQLLDSLAKQDWSNAGPLAFANILNGLAQIGVKLTAESPAIQKILEGMAKQNWSTAKPIEFANAVNGLAQIGVKLTIKSPVIQKILAGMAKRNWSNALPIDYANIFNGFAQMGIKLTATTPGIQEILTGMTAQDWGTALPIHFANTLNGIAQSGIKLPMRTRIIQNILAGITNNQYWTSASPMSIANTLNGLMQSGIKLTADAPAIQQILAGMRHQKWDTASPIELAYILNSLVHFNIDKNQLKAILDLFNLQSKWSTLFSEENKYLQTSMAHVAGYIHFVLQDAALQQTYPLKSFTLNYSDPSSFQKSVHSCLKKKLRTCKVLMEYHQDEFAYLGSPVDIGIQDIETEKIIGFVEVEGHTHYERSGQFNHATEWKHTLLQNFAKKQDIVFGIVGNPVASALNETEILDQLQPFLDSLPSKGKSKEEPISQEFFITADQQSTGMQPKAVRKKKKAKSIVSASEKYKEPTLQTSDKKKNVHSKSEPKNLQLQMEPALANNYKQMGKYAVSMLFAASSIAYAVYKSFNQDREPS